jgi:hypothetical protein
VGVAPKVVIHQVTSENGEVVTKSINNQGTVVSDSTSTQQQQQQ